MFHAKDTILTEVRTNSKPRNAVFTVTQFLHVLQSQIFDCIEATTNMTNSVCGDRGATLSIIISQIFDYLGATTMVMMSLYCMLVRISGRDQFGKIKSQRYVMLIYHLLYTSRGISELKIISNIPRHLFPAFAGNK